MSSAPQLAFAFLSKPTFYKQRDNHLFPAWNFSVAQARRPSIRFACMSDLQQHFCCVSPCERRSCEVVSSRCIPLCPTWWPLSVTQPCLQVITQLPQSTVEAIVFSLVVYWVRRWGAE